MVMVENRNTFETASHQLPSTPYNSVQLRATCWTMAAAVPTSLPSCSKLRVLSRTVAAADLQLRGWARREEEL